MISNSFLGPKKYLGFKFIRSRKGGIKLVDSQGYDYEKKVNTKGELIGDAFRIIKTNVKQELLRLTPKL